MKENDGYYIIQKGVENLLLYKNRKFDSRVHILITKEGQVYLFNESVIRISFKFFSENCYCKKHQLTNGSLGVEAISSNDLPFWNKLVPGIIESLKEIMDEMICFRDEQGYAIIGIDFIFSDLYKAYVLECNTYPNLNYVKKDPHIYKFIRKMLDSTIDIVCFNNIDNNLWQRIM